jgi:PAS domain S-box-containing protein
MLQIEPSPAPQLNLFQAIVEQAADAIIFADRDGAIRVWNSGAESLFGYSAAEVAGNSLDVIIPERLRRAHWEGFRKAIKTGQTKYGNRVLTTRSMHKNGSKLYLDLSFALVKDEAGAVAGALAIGRDCTGRYASDSALRARVLELEQKLEVASKQTSSPHPLE